jgi:hypothetical protein
VARNWLAFSVDHELDTDVRLERYFSKIPFDPIGKSAGTFLLEEGKDLVCVLAIDIDLVGDNEFLGIALDESTNLLVASWLLLSKLIAGK